MTNRIVDTPPNSGLRRSAEVLAGLQGVGIVTAWTHPDHSGDHTDCLRVIFAHRLPGATEAVVAMTPEQVLWFSRGVLAQMSQQRDEVQKSVDATYAQAGNLARAGED